MRRQEEIIWIREQGFSRVISLLPSPHNLHAYDELGVEWEHVPFGPHDDPRTVLADLYPTCETWLAAGEKLLVHQEELGDRLWASWPATCCGPAWCRSAPRPSRSSSRSSTARWARPAANWWPSPPELLEPDDRG